MQFRQREFMLAMGAKIPYDVTWFHRAGVMYLFARFPLKRDFLYGTVIDTLFVTLIDPPPGTLRDTLIDTLETLENYVKISQLTHMSETGERQTLFEYQIDINRLQGLVNRVVLCEEMCDALTLIEQDDFVSVRLLRDKMQMTGRNVSQRRAALILEALEQEGYIHGNGLIRTRGREVVREHSQAG